MSQSFDLHTNHRRSAACRDARARVKAIERRLAGTMYLLRVYVKQFRRAKTDEDRNLAKKYGIEWEKGAARMYREQLVDARALAGRLEAKG